MKFSLNGFQKVSKTGDNTTLRHPSGHELTIKHTLLSPKLRGDIEALPHISEKHPDTEKPKAPTVAKFADGTIDTPVQQVETSYNKAAGTTKPPTPEDIAREQKNAAIRNRNTTNASGETSASNQTYADGGKVEEQDNGPDAADKRITEQNKAAEDKEASDKTADTERSEQAVSKEQESAPKGPGGPDDLSKLIDAHHKLVSAVSPAAAQSGSIPSSTPQQSVQPTTPQDQSAAGVGQMVQPVTPQDQAAAGVNQPTPAQPGQPATPTSSDDQAAAGSQPTAAPAQPGSSIPGYAAPAANASTASAGLNRYIQEQETKEQALQKAVQDGKINPDRYFQNMGTSGKISTILGLVLGGLGSGHNGGKNMAAEALNTAIERDVDAQKTDTTNKANLYKMNLEATRNGIEARAMTINQQLALAKAAIDKQAASTTNTTALANLANLKEDLITKQYSNAANAFQAKMRDQVLSGGSGGIPLSSKIQYGLPKEQQAEGEKQASEYDSLKRTADNVNQIFDNMEKEQTAGNLANPQSYLRQKQNKAALVQAIMETSPSKRLTKESIEQEIKPFEFGTGSTQQTIDAARKGVLDIVKAHSGPMNLLADRGMIPPLDQITHSSPTKYLNGIPYKLGPDNQYHKVK